MEIVLQSPLFEGGYVSELIDGKFQIMASGSYRGQYVIYNHLTELLVRTKKDEVQLFSSLNAARVFVGAGVVEVKEKKKAVGYVKKGRKESALSYMKELLLSHGNTTDQQIADMVKKKFPDSNYNASMVKFNRKKLAKG